MKHPSRSAMWIAGAWLIVAACLPGCSAGTADPQAVALTQVSTDHETLVSSWNLTAEEIAAFLEVVQRLPRQQVPEFAGADLPRITSTEGLEAALLEYRLAIRSGLSPGHQAERWAKDSELQAVFQTMRVSPIAFADLMVRISCAWSARQIQEELSLAQARHQIDEHIARLAAALEKVPSSDVLDQLESLELLVARSEFLRLLEQAPPSSIQAVASAHSDLQAIMPKTDLARELRETLEAQSKILRVGYSASND